MAAPSLAALVLVSLAPARGAEAAVACPEPAGPAAGPLPGGIGPADFGAVPEACSGTELGLRLRGTLLVASAAPDFFGVATGAATLRARHPLGARTWASVALDVLTYRYVANAVVTSSGASVGPPTVGLYRALRDDQTDALAAYARVLLPLDTARARGVETGLELGLAGRRLLGPRAGVEGGLALPATLDVTAGVAHGALRPAALLEVFWRPRPWLALSAGAGARAQAAPAPSFTSAAPRLAARFALRGGFSLAVLAEVPVVGDDRTDAIAALFLGWAPPKVPPTRTLAETPGIAILRGLACPRSR